MTTETNEQSCAGCTNLDDAKTHCNFHDRDVGLTDGCGDYESAGIVWLQKSQNDQPTN